MKQSDMFPLSPEQLDAARRDLKNAILERNRVQAEKKLANDSFKEQIDLLEKRIDQLAYLLDDHDKSIGRGSFFADTGEAGNLAESVAGALIDPANAGALEKLRPTAENGMESVSVITDAGSVTLHADGRTERSGKAARSGARADA